MMITAYIAAGLMSVSGWISVEMNGRKGLPEGVFVSREQEENYNVATGGSTIGIRRSYMVWRPGGYVFFGMPAGNDPANFDVRAASRSQSNRVGIGRLFGARVFIRSRSGGTPTVIEAPLSPEMYSLGNQRFYKAKPSSAQQIVGQYFYSSVQTAPLPGGNSDPIGARIELTQDGVCLAQGLDTLDGNSSAIGGYQQSGPMRGQFRMNGYSLTINLAGKVSTVSCFFDPDPAAKGEVLLIAGIPFSRVRK